MTDQPDRRRALAFNAVGPAINQAGYWLPLSARRAVADAVLEAIDDPAVGYCPHCGRGDAGPTADQYEQLRQRARQDAAASRESERILQQQIDRQATEIDRLQANERRVRRLADQWFVAGPTGTHIQVGKELFAALEPLQEPAP